jgi:p-aminobenzoyl-glutamate transporter AbgT
MAEFFTAEYQWMWALILTLALFFPVRSLIWGLAVRRAIKKQGDIEDEQRMGLKKRAGMTSILLCFVFSYFYTLTLF